MTYTIKKITTNKFYIYFIYTFFFLIWSLKFFFSQTQLLNITFIFLTIPALMWFLILITQDDTKETIPILLGILFSLGAESLDLSTISHFKFAIAPIVLLLGGIIIHLIEFRVRIKLKTLGLSFIFIAISFLIPLTYRLSDAKTTNEFSNMVMLSSLGLLYALVYLFYANTIKKMTYVYLFKNLLLTSILLSAQVVTLLTVYMIDNHMWPYEAIISLVTGNRTKPMHALGWGNINDLTIHLVLFMSSVLFFIHKYPQKIIYWLLYLWFGLVIFISQARGSVITYAILSLLLFIYFLKHKNPIYFKNLIKTVIIAFIIICLNAPLFYKLLTLFIDSLSGDTNSVLSGRITIWKDAINTFKIYPFFGSGWFTDKFYNQNRITVYHSTFFHVLATGGIFGIIVLIFHSYQIFKLFKLNWLRPSIFFIITYLITQFHGLLDNTQYMLIFTLSTTVIFTSIESIDSKLIDIP